MTYFVIPGISHDNYVVEKNFTFRNFAKYFSVVFRIFSKFFSAILPILIKFLGPPEKQLRNFYPCFSEIPPNISPVKFLPAIFFIQ